MKTLVLCLGNDLIADDAIGIHAANALRDRVRDWADVEERSVSGVALLESFIGYTRAIIVDAIHTQKYPPGTIIELRPSDLHRVIAPSPHYTGLPELIEMARQMELDFPEEILIFAVEAEDTLTIGGELSNSVRRILPQLLQRVEEQLRRWNEPPMEDHQKGNAISP